MTRDDEPTEQEAQTSGCAHPNTHMTYAPVDGGVKEYIVCTSCSDRTLVAFHPSS